MQTEDDLLRFDFSHPDLWIPAFHKLNWARKRYKLLYGSRGRGGTTNVVQVLVAKMLASPIKGVMVRKIFEDIRGSQWDSIKAWCEEKRIDHHFSFQKTPLEIVCNLTGARIVARGMDKPGRAKSVPGLSFAWYEEADELTAEDFRQTDLSIRGNDIEQWLTFNSPDKDHWILQRFFRGHISEKGKFTPDLSFERSDGMFTDVPSSDPDAMIVHACYKHNPFNKQSFITAQERDEATNYDSFKTSGLGLIGSSRSGMEFFPEFTESKHVRPNIYDPRRALHITFDFNTSPYMTLLVSQIKQKDMGRWSVDFLKEYCPEHPLSTPKAACMMLKNDLKEGKFAGHDAGLLVYGDRSGKSNKTGESEVVIHDFDVVFTELSRWVDNRSDRVMRSNPPHAKAREFMGHCFSGRLPVDITFDPSMHNTISDHLHLKQGPDGGILKEYAVDQVTKAKYEKHGHCAQAAYYEVISAFKDMYDDMGSLAA